MSLLSSGWKGYGIARMLTDFLTLLGLLEGKKILFGQELIGCGVLLKEYWFRCGCHENRTPCPCRRSSSRILRELEAYA